MEISASDAPDRGALSVQMICSLLHTLDLTVVTDNVREFSRIPDLRIENWLTE
jgi:predicted nucleic acid-binding protein